MNRRRWLAYSVVAVVCVGCAGPETSQDFDETSRTLELQFGPLRVSTFARLYLTARFSGAGMQPLGRSAVDVTASFVDSIGLRILADGESYRYKRVLFKNFLVRIPLNDFLKIGHASRVVLELGTDFVDADPYVLNTGEIEGLDRFTSLVEHHLELARQRNAGKGDTSRGQARGY